MKLGFASDHRGFALKMELIELFKEKGYDIIDVGTNSNESCDYPDIARKVCEKVITNGADRGILVCGTGIGMSIVANKVHGIRAALCGDTYSARVSRAHNNANVLCLGSRVIGEHLALDIVDCWLKTGFEGGRHKKRVDMIE